MIKKTICFLTLMMAASIAAGGLTASAAVFQKYTNSSLNSGTKNSAHASLRTYDGESRITSTSSSYNGRYKWVYAETYFVNNNGSVVFTMDTSSNSGNGVSLGCSADRTAANNFLGIGQLGSSSASATGVEETIVVLTRKNTSTIFLDSSYYDDYLS